MMQLAKHRLALRRKEFEARHSSRKGVMTELVMREESLVSMHAVHLASNLSELRDNSGIVG